MFRGIVLVLVVLSVMFRGIVSVPVVLSVMFRGIVSVLAAFLEWRLQTSDVPALSAEGPFS